MQIENAVWISGEGTSRGTIRIESGVISSVGDATSALPGDRIPDGGVTIFPGFIDIHIHGAAGVDVNSASAEELLDVGVFLAQNGVTTWVPTLVPDSDEIYRRVIAEIDRLMELQEGRPVAQAVGVHYEGVFANESMCGALRPEFFKKFTGVELDELPRLKRGVHMTTFAPEIEGGVELAAELSRQGWLGSIGHSRADTDTLDAALASGARHMTHFFNAMTGIHHRSLGVAGWGLANPEVTFDIIADGEHVHPQMLKLACRVKDIDNILLISDSIAPTGVGEGEFELWGEKLRVENGRTSNERGSIAGSVITMHDAFIRMRSLGFEEGEVAKMTASNPARLLGLEGSRGSVQVGKRADLVGVDQDGSIRFVTVGGQYVDLSSSPK